MQTTQEAATGVRKPLDLMMCATQKPACHSTNRGTRLRASLSLPGPDDCRAPASLPASADEACAAAADAHWIRVGEARPCATSPLEEAAHASAAAAASPGAGATRLPPRHTSFMRTLKPST